MAIEVDLALTVRGWRAEQYFEQSYRIPSSWEEVEEAGVHQDLYVTVVVVVAAACQSQGMEEEEEAAAGH